MIKTEREYPDPCERYEDHYRDMIEYEREYDYYLDDFDYAEEDYE